MSNKSDCLTKTFHVLGDLDEEAVPALLRQVEEALDHDHTHLIIDLSQANQISASGTFALQSIEARAAARGGKTVFLR